MFINLVTNAQFWITILIALLSFQLGKRIGHRETVERLNKIIDGIASLSKTMNDKTED